MQILYKFTLYSKNLYIYDYCGWTSYLFMSYKLQLCKYYIFCSALKVSCHKKTFILLQQLSTYSRVFCLSVFV